MTERVPAPKCDFAEWCTEQSVVTIVDHRLPIESPHMITSLCRRHYRAVAANMLAAHHITLAYAKAPWDKLDAQVEEAVSAGEDVEAEDAEADRVWSTES